jgi:cytochrome c oxidase subunit I
MTAVAERPSTSQSPFRRPRSRTGLWSWVTTVDHKKIGILYFITLFVFFILGGVEALLLRVQLAAPEAQVLTADQYNQLFTMHGVTMIFFVVMPMGAAFANYLLPLQIGARDMAFPRLNMLSYWVFLIAGLFTFSSIFLGGMPDGGWFAYAPQSTSVGPDPNAYTVADHASRMLYYSLGIQIAGVASLASAVNFIVTIFNMRAPGMTLMRMPVFTWMMLITAFLILFALPVLGVALWQMMFDLRFGGNFFNPAGGGDPVMWQHLFWVFGHPEVYLMILPAFGIVSETLPVFARKPLFGYTAIVFSGIAIAFMGWGVWAHHMFAVGMGPVANTAFALSTMFIAVPTGIKIFNWLGTLWGGQIRLNTAMLFGIALVAQFTIGGLSGVTHSLAPHNYQQTDTYYVVAHFHYVLFGGALFGFFSGIYYWFPKAFGKFLGEGLGKLHFWSLVLGFNLTFGPMHILGLNGMPRRIDTYADGMGWNWWNLVATVGSFVIAASILVWIVNVVISLRSGAPAGRDPWDARTVEWMTTSPPPAHNFDRIPQVTARDELWHRKYQPDGARIPIGTAQMPAPAEATAPPAEGIDHSGHAAPGAETPGEEPGATAVDIHLPDPSYYPLIVALGMPLMAYGVIFSMGTPLMWLLTGVGALVTLAGMFGWVLEPSVEEHHADATEPHARTQEHR